MFDTEPPIPLEPRLQDGIDAVLREAVNPEAPALIAGIQRASRYANVSKSSGKIRYTRRVLTLGIVEMASSESYPSMNWVGEWLRGIYTGVEGVLREQDKSEAVRIALERTRQILVHSGLAGTISRAKEIAQRTSGRDRIDLRHLVFALTELPGRAFKNFPRQPTHAELSDLRAMIVRDAESDSRENPKEWQMLREEADAATPTEIVEDREEEDIDSGGEPMEIEAASSSASKVGPGDVQSVDAAPEERDTDVQIPFVLDAPTKTEDDLDRGPLALFLARRLHLIWCQVNGHAPDADGKPSKPATSDSDTFIAHVDSPWGGGKTTFANFVERVLNPPPDEALSPGHFLRSSLAKTLPDNELASVPLNDVFVPPFAKLGQAGAEKWSGARRPWIIAHYNAWRDQFVQPPWWQIFQAIHRAIAREIRNEAAADLRAGRIAHWDDGTGRWMDVQLYKFTYKVWNSKLKAQLALWLLVAGLFLVLWGTGVVGYVLGSSSSVPAGSARPVIDAGKASDWVTLAVAILGLGGASVATLFTVFSQSISPDLDFTSEHKLIGVRDPILRFRRTFSRILGSTDRPILLIVDDLDRCEPSTVVEIMRGFQTIIRSPRLFVLLLGDRAWIEGAHDIQHKDLLALEGYETKLGSLYVRKVIQLSLRLPVMKAESRERFARRVLGERDEAAAKEAAEALTEVESATGEIASGPGSIGFKEAEISSALERANQRFDSLPEAERARAKAVAVEIANTQLIAAAGADTAQQREVFNAITKLIDCLPNNPRQIKRIFMAFATYEQVGRRLYNYSLTAAGENGEHRARRWRQLALWVTLSVEWPATWRAIARRPRLLDAAYGPKKKQASLQRALLRGLPASDRPALIAVLRRMQTDAALVALLTKDMSDSAAEGREFASTALESAAVYEFNRIIWEPGFLLQPELGH